MVKEIVNEETEPLENISKIPAINYKPTHRQVIKNLDLVKGNIYRGIKDLKNIGFEATNCYRAYEIWQNALNKNYKIILGFTSNVSSCGLRDVVAELCKNKLVDCLVTTGGAIEEDILKTRIPAKIKEKKIEDKELYSVGINRTQNLYFPNQGYVFFEKFLTDLFEKDPKLKNTTVRELVNTMGKEINSEQSFVFWCYKNEIPVITGGLEDCATGDFYGIKNFKFLKSTDSKKKEESYVLNSAFTLTDYLDFLISDDRKICTIILGGGFVKHMVMNGCIAAGGCDKAIYMNNEPYYTGSNCGAPLEEAVSWGKLKSDSLEQGESIKVNGDFIIPFLLVASEILMNNTRSKNSGV